MRSNEDLLVGTVATLLVVLIALRIVRGLREGRLPVYRTYLERDGDQAKFTGLLVLHVASLLLVAAIAADLLLGLNLKGR